MIKGLLEGKRWAALWKALPEYYVPGFIMTLKISIVGLLVALLLGIVFGTFSTMKFKPAKILARIYVEFLQNTPLALQILFYYSVLPLLFSNSGFRIPKFVLGVIGVGVYHGAYIAEVIRTGIEAVPKGQSEAAASQGFSYLETMYYIILPQTIRIIMPPLANQALNLVKNTSILAMVAGMDLMYYTDSWGADRGYFAQAYFTSALLYFIICFPLARLGRYLEIRSMRLPAPKKIVIKEDGLSDFHLCQCHFYAEGSCHVRRHRSTGHRYQHVFRHHPGADPHLRERTVPMGFCPCCCIHGILPLHAKPAVDSLDLFHG